MSLIKTPAEIEALAEGGKILSKILAHLASQVRPEISTADLDRLAREDMQEYGVQPAFEGYQISPSIPAYPAVLCASVDHEVVHGIPRPNKILRGGQIIGLDLGIIHKGLYTDSALTVPVGHASEQARALIGATREALAAGIEQVKPGNHIGDIAHAISRVAKKHGFGVIRDLIGHGVGHKLHEKPDVPNYGRAGTLEELKPGMVIAIEPMFTTGDYRINILDDGWTIVTADRSLAAHFEHTVGVTENGCRILTDWQVPLSLDSDS